MRRGRPVGKSETVKVGPLSSSLPCACGGEVCWLIAVVAMQAAASSKPATLGKRPIKRRRRQQSARSPDGPHLPGRYWPTLHGERCCRYVRSPPGHLVGPG